MAFFNMKGIVNFFTNFTKVEERAQEVINEVKETVEDISEVVDEKLTSVSSHITDAVETIENLGTVQLLPIEGDEFHTLIADLNLVEGKHEEGSESIINSYYCGPRLIAVSVRWPSTTFFFKAKYNLF